MFDSIMDKHASATAPKPADVPDVLYHYTDAAGLKGILSSGRLWATDYRFLNDKSELAHTEDLVEDPIAERVSEDRGDILRELYSRIISDHNLSKRYPALFFSLSEDGDSLSQWRGYGRDGQGYTIGFSGPALLEVASSGPDFDLRKVVYDRQRQLRCLKMALDDIEKTLLKESSKPTANKDAILTEATSAAKFITLAQSISNKHHSFSSEAEWRLTTFIASKSEQSSVKVRARGMELVPYLELNLTTETLASLPIIRIGIGPGFVSDNQKIAAKNLCREHGYSPEIYSADSPYRRA